MVLLLNTSNSNVPPLITDNVILHILPLHHIHGLINGLLTSHFIGAKEYLIHSGPEQQVTVFTGVSTVYAKLIYD
ncbi:unnamed protein product [Rotaria sp. Silwood2]|nr:unnamed protein product [Rotaria sp. Silwood2]